MTYKNPLQKKYEVRYQTGYKTSNCSPTFTIIVEAVGGAAMALEQVYGMFGGRDNCKINGWRQIN